MPPILSADSCVASLWQLARSLTESNKPSSSEYRSVEEYVHQEQPLVPSEQDFIYRKEDLIILGSGREHAWLDSSIERTLRFLHCDIIEVSFVSRGVSSVSADNLH
jgi:hypothetical protein